MRGAGCSCGSFQAGVGCGVSAKGGTCRRGSIGTGIGPGWYAGL